MNTKNRDASCSIPDYMLLSQKLCRKNRPIFLILFLLGLLGLNPVILLAQSRTSTPSKGRQLFINHCGRCHGIQGGGGTGPSLQHPTLLRALDDEALAAIIKGGIPGTGMPGNWMLKSPDLDHLIDHVRQLGKTETEPIRGDVTEGKAIFHLKGACITCHIVQGQGRSLGPELTDVGLRRGADYLREAIRHPGKNQPVDREGFTTFLVVEAEQNNGGTVRGVRINEDTFTIQIRDAANQVHSLRKGDLKSLRSGDDESLMPSYQETLTTDEIENLVAFLASLKH